MSQKFKSLETKSSTGKKTVTVTELDTDSDEQSDESKLQSTIKKLFLSKQFLKMTKGSGTITTSMVLLNTLTMNGSGAYLSYIPMDPSSATEWSSFATLFDEFRILHASVDFQPIYAGSTCPGNVVVAYDNDSLTTPGSQTDVCCYQNYRVGPLYKGLKYLVHRPNVTPSAYWADVATPSGSSGSVPYVVGFSAASTQTVQVFTTYQIEFRGRR